MHAFTPDEAKRFLGAARGTRHGVLFTLALDSGMRPSEYLALKWSDVDFKRGTVTVQRSVTFTRGGWSFTETKTPRSRRTVPLTSATLDGLRFHKARQAEERLRLGEHWHDHGLVFTDCTGEPIDRHNLNHRHFKPLLSTADLGGHFRLYDLRHACATLLLQKGINPKVVSGRLGHASIVQTLDTYSHVLPDMQQAAVDVMAEITEALGR